MTEQTPIPDVRPTARVRNMALAGKYGSYTPSETAALVEHECDALDANIDASIAAAVAAERARLRETVEALDGQCHDGEGLGCETDPCVENVSRAVVLALLAPEPAAPEAAS